MARTKRDGPLTSAGSPAIPGPCPNGATVTTGVYWASDSFATPMLTPVPDVTTLDEAFWTDGMNMFDQYVSPWVTMVAEAKFQRTVDRVEALAPRVLTGCHTPVVREAFVARALATTRRTPTAIVPPQPDQSVLEQIQQSLLAAA